MLHNWLSVHMTVLAPRKGIRVFSSRKIGQTGHLNVGDLSKHNINFNFTAGVLNVNILTISHFQSVDDSHNY